MSRDNGIGYNKDSIVGDLCVIQARRSSKIVGLEGTRPRPG